MDTNILVHAHRKESLLHQLALEKIKALAEGDEVFALPVFCLAEFVRVVTHPRLFDPPTPISEAVSALDSLLQSPVSRILYPTKQYWRHFSEACTEGNASGNLVFDAQIVALLRDNGIRELLTEDRDFLRFKGVKSVHLSTG